MWPLDAIIWILTHVSSIYTDCFFLDDYLMLPMIYYPVVYIPRNMVEDIHCGRDQMRSYFEIDSNVLN